MNTVKEAMQHMILQSLNDDLLDEPTLRLIHQVFRRAREGWQDSEITGYLAYCKRIADRNGKDRVQRVRKAWRTDRWGLVTLVKQLQEAAARDRDSEARSREAHEVWYLQQAEARAMIPEDKRGRASKGRSRGTDYRPAPPRTEEQDALIILRHNERVKQEAAMRRAASQ